ncbi:MAG: UMP kinase [Bryobacterales bacterium]
MSAYRRILLKLSGEALGGESGFGLDAKRAGEIAAETAALVRSGVQVGLVLGGGNYFRGVRDAGDKLERTTVDAMGMLATVINALAFRDLLRAEGVPAETLSAIAMEPLAVRFDKERAVALLEAGTATLFAAGTGNPYFSTDTAASLRAIEIGADIVMKATKVDGVYDSDPKKNPAAKRYAKITYAEVLEKGLGVMDATAVALCRENRMPVLVFDLNDPGAMARAVAGESVGTLMS